MYDTEAFVTIKALCMRIIHNPNDASPLSDLLKSLQSLEPTCGRVIQPTILSTFYPIIKSISEGKCSYKEDDKRLFIDILRVLFEKTRIEKLALFFNIYALLLFEIYDAKKHRVLHIHEEYKLSIIQCMASLAKSVSSELLLSLYCKQNATKLSQMLYVCIELAKNEKLRALRIAAMECIMALSHVSEEDDSSDIVLRGHVADMFLFFLPGLASGLKHIALEDEKVGHKVPLIAIKTWGRVITLIAQDYRAEDEKIMGRSTRLSFLKKESLNKKLPDRYVDNKQNIDELKYYIQKTTKTQHWYKETDTKLQGIVAEFMKLTHHPHPNLRLELVGMAKIFLECCLDTLPNTASKVIELLIALSEDNDEKIAKDSKHCIEDLSGKLSSDEMKILLESLEEGFFNTISGLPRKFNGIDEQEQVATLNLVVGYINIFGKYNLSHVLLSAMHLRRLLTALIHISQIEKNKISLLEEYAVQDFETAKIGMRAAWKEFVYFRGEEIEMKIKSICQCLSRNNAIRITSDYLLDVYLYEPHQRNEAVFLLNELFTVVQIDEECMNVVQHVITVYTEKRNWYLPLSVMIDDLGYEHSSSEIQGNIIQVCLMVEGIGKIALLLRDRFSSYLLKTLHLVLERAGSAQPVIQTAGLKSLSNIAVALSHPNITALIISNIDYIQYHLERKLQKLQENEPVLNILTVLFKYSTLDTLPSNVIEKVLMHSCDKFKEKYSTQFLMIFKMFITCLHRLMNIQPRNQSKKTKMEKLKEIGDFKVTGITENNDFSDNVMEKSAEDMYKEDMEKGQKEIEKEINGSVGQEYKKPEPPHHIKLSVSVLTRTLHFLPSKNIPKKLLALDILTAGVEILENYEDELLPIVHQIWSPLVDRFKPTEDHLVVNLSTQLLSTLAYFSKEFIRSRTTKDVLPNIIQILDGLSNESFLKDKGSAYRYCQAYKLQLTLLENLPRILTDLDLSKCEYSNVNEAVFKYLSNKQPVPLQEAAIFYYKYIDYYDPQILQKDKENWREENNEEYKFNINKLVKQLLESNVD